MSAYPQRAAATVLLAAIAASGTAQSIWDAADQPHDNVGELRCRGGAGFEFKSLGFKQLAFPM